MSIHPLAQELNATIKRANPYLMEMLSRTGRRLFFPKGILSQSAEAREKADPKFNATIGMATEHRRTMFLPSVMSTLEERFKPEDALTYAPSYGIPELRQIWKESLYEKNPSLVGKAISLPVVTNGITHGISVFADLFLDPDDVVVFPDKMWGNNNLIMSVRGDACIHHYPMFNSRGGYNVDAFEECITKEAENNYKVVTFLNFPNNPTGYTITEPEATRIVEILTRLAEHRTNVIAVTDDAYFGLRYDEAPINESLFARLCDRHPRLLAVKLDGATKEMFAWGLRVGFMTYGIRPVNGEYAPLYDAMERKTAANIRGTVSNASRVSQSIVLKAMRSSSFREERKEKVAILRRRAQRVKEVLSNPKFREVWDTYPFNSGYFMCIRLKRLVAEQVRLHLLNAHGVGLIATDTRDLRIAFSCVDEEDIGPLFEIIYNGVRELESRT